MDAKRLLQLAAITLAIVFNSGCGGGGGGSGDSADPDDPGEISLRVTENTIDTGDRTTVRVIMSNVNPDGVAVKIRFPSQLAYVLGSSQIEINGNQYDTAPTNNQTASGKVYLVYYFSRSFIGDSDAELTFKLEANQLIADGLAEADIDLDDPLVDNQDEFEISNPEFVAQTQDGIVVLGEATPTPTPTPSA